MPIAAASEVECIDGFEFQQFSATGFNAGGTLLYAQVPGTTVATSDFYTGAACAEIAPTGAAAGNILKGSTAGIASSDGKTCAFWIKFVGSLPAAAANLCRFEGAGAGVCTVQFQSSSTRFAVIVAGGGTATAIGPTIVTGRWYHIQAQAFNNSTTYTITARVDNDPTTEGTATLAGQTAQQITAVMLGTRSTTGPAYTARFDDWVVTNTINSYPIGIHRCPSAFPVQDAAHNGGTNTIEDNAGTDIGASFTTAYTLVNEVPPENADYIQQSASGSGNYAEIRFAQAQQRQVLAVNAYAAVEAAAVNSSGMIFRVTDSGGTTLVDQGTATTTTSGTTRRYSQKMVPVPASGTNWGQDQFNGLLGRMGFSTDVSPVPRALTFMLQYLVLTDPRPVMPKLPVNHVIDRGSAI